VIAAQANDLSWHSLLHIDQPLDDTPTVRTAINVIADENETDLSPSVPVLEPFQHALELADLSMDVADRARYDTAALNSRSRHAPQLPRRLPRVNGGHGGLHVKPSASLFRPNREMHQSHAH
jgi:hypothetical protein